jgi:hypothetical protein
MKSFASLLGFAALLSVMPAMADQLYLQNVQSGYISPSDLTSFGQTEGTGYQNDGYTDKTNDYGSSYYPSVPVGDYAQITSIYQNVNYTVNALVLWDAVDSDGGWFGVSGSNQDGTTTTEASTLSASALILPTLQYTTDDLDSTTTPPVWQDVAFTSNYLTAMKGAAVGSVVESVFTLDAPVSGATSFRLVGEAGGASAANGGGWLDVTELQEYGTVPEPSTYAMMFGGLGLLVLIARMRRKLVA